MIPRYQRPEMTEIWSEAAQFRQRLRVEAAVAQAQADFGIVPQSAATTIAEQAEIAPYNAEAIRTIEDKTRHDVVAMLTYFSGFLGSAAPYLHFGITSSDLLDTSLALCLVKACDLLDDGCSRVLDKIETRAKEHKTTICIGRSHGIHAEPTSFGIKLAGHYAEFDRARTSLRDARTMIGTCAISGAVGTYAHNDPRVEARVAERLGLAIEPISTQVIPRDRHARVFLAHSLIAAAIERLAIEFRHLQRSEVSEIEESFGGSQTGSSAMPHKRNPISAENLTGIARLVRSYVAPALENIVLWHERDISHSSVERVLIPDSFTILDYGLHRLSRLVGTLVVKPERMADQVNRLGGIYATQRVMLAMIEKGCTREDAYRLMQGFAHQAIENESNFRELLNRSPDISRLLSDQELDTLFDQQQYLRHVDIIFDRVFPGQSDAWTA